MGGAKFRLTHYRKFATVEDGGYVGLILAPGGFINPVRIAPVDGKGVDYVITVDGQNGFDLGVAWKRHSSKTGKAYLSVKLDSAFLPAPVNWGSPHDLFKIVR